MLTIFYIQCREFVKEKHGKSAVFASTSIGKFSILQLHNKF